MRKVGEMIRKEMAQRLLVEPLSADPLIAKLLGSHLVNDYSTAWRVLDYAKAWIDPLAPMTDPDGIAGRIRC